MREIKFRLWDCDNNGFEYVNFNDLELLRQSLDGFEDYFHKDYFKDNPTYIQHFTGLKDKNGVEIYEGDIFTFGKVEWCNGAWRFNNNNCYMVIDEHIAKNIEVIGNIHENEL